MELEIGGRSMSGAELVEMQLEDLARTVERVRQSALEFEEAILQKDWEKAEELHANLYSQLDELGSFVETADKFAFLEDVDSGFWDV